MTLCSLVVETNIMNKKKILVCSGQKEVKLKNWFLSMLEQYTRLHGVTTQKRGIVTSREVNTSNVMQLSSHSSTSVMEEEEIL
jgi:hypothetical protein